MAISKLPNSFIFLTGNIYPSHMFQKSSTTWSDWGIFLASLYGQVNRRHKHAQKNQCGGGSRGPVSEHFSCTGSRVGVSLQNVPATFAPCVMTSRGLSRLSFHKGQKCHRLPRAGRHSVQVGAPGVGAQRAGVATAFPMYLHVPTPCLFPAT